MSYNTYHQLAVYNKQGELLDNDQQEIHKEAVGKLSGYDYHLWENEFTWYEESKHMTAYSKKFPDLVFNISGTGEESEDLWEAYYLNGERQSCPAKITYEPCQWFEKPGTIQAENVMKVVDVHHTQLSSATTTYLQMLTEPTYRDQILKEHIYNIADIFDEYREDSNAMDEVMSDLETLIVLQNSNDAGYTRIIYS